MEIIIFLQKVNKFGLLTYFSFKKVTCFLSYFLLVVNTALRPMCANLTDYSLHQFLLTFWLPGLCYTFYTYLSLKYSCSWLTSLFFNFQIRHWFGHELKPCPCFEPKKWHFFNAEIWAIYPDHEPWNSQLTWKFYTSNSNVKQDKTYLKEIPH